MSYEVVTSLVVENSESGAQKQKKQYVSHPCVKTEKQYVTEKQRFFCKNNKNGLFWAVT